MLGTHKARLDNRWGCPVGHAFRNFNPPLRFDAHSRPSGGQRLNVSPLLSIPK
jgi:hypothetical protein